ncbi:MAG: helicase-related protein [bacterium]
MDKNLIKRGVVVYLDTNPGKLGKLTGKTMPLGDLIMAQVNWGANTEHQSIEHLCIHEDSNEEGIPGMLERSEYGRVEDLRLCMTYEKLQGSLTDVFYSMAAAQIDFLPHQFKPVLRFVDSPTNRLLIADEVGLGKTIEAGLIWLECQARYAARRLLVICPAMLCLKWQRELREKFQLDVHIADVDQLTDLMDEFDRIGDKLSFNVICSYNALRPLKNERDILDAFVNGTKASPIDDAGLSARGRLLKRMAQRDSGIPFINLVVFDEAAVMKNTGTSTHALGRIASSESGACVCLSATPIHNQSRDLYALLSLVDPDYFHSEYIFDVLRDRNHPVVELSNRLASNQLRKDDLLRIVDTLEKSDYFGPSSILAQIRSHIETGDMNAKAIAEMAGLAEKLNLLSNYICRTRKVQISTNGRVLRRPVVLQVAYTAEEMRFYAAVLKHIRDRIRRQGIQATSFHTMGPALRMASCMPVMADLLKRGRWGGIEELIESELTDADDSILVDDEDDAVVPDFSQSMAWIRDYDFEDNDSKYRQLRSQLLHEIGHDKVVLFAFFKDTLKYLARRLSKEGFKVALLTGDIADQQERENIILNFEQRDVQILLCSEVAAEGIDLQFCHTLVNYDLPWNPMRVEQRIGRLDRIGQKAKVITVINFQIKGTVDGLIFEHLYRKIGIFEHTIGDLETILGPEIARLTSCLLSSELTDAETVKQIQQIASAIEGQRLAQVSLERSGNDMMAFADYLAEQVGNSHRLGRYVRPSELRIYLTDFFAREYSGCRLDWDTPQSGCGTLTLSHPAADSLQAFGRQENLSIPAGLVGTIRGFQFAIDPETYSSVRRKFRSMALVNHLHPLVKWVTRIIRDRGETLHRIAGVRVSDTVMPPGRYFFQVRRVVLNGLHKREHLVHALSCLNTGRIMHGEKVERLINCVLEGGESLFPGQTTGMKEVFLDLSSHLNNVCASTITAYEDEMSVKHQVQEEQAKAHFGRKIETTKRQIESMQLSTESRVRGLALAERNLKSYENALAAKLEEISKRMEMRVTAEDVVCGIVEVNRP